jgi:HlyD family secretion protein
MIFKHVTFYLAVAGLVGGVVLVKKLGRERPVPPPLVEPARSPYARSVAATGIIEASRENVKIGAIKAGLVKEVFAKVGAKVSTGEPLLQLDDRETRARLESIEASLRVLEAALELEQVQQADMEDQFQRVERLERDRVASEDERKRKEFALRNTRAKVSKARAEVDATKRQIEQARVDLEVLTVRAPRDGTMLQVNIRAGEYATLMPAEPMMILGDVDKLQIRADVDEQDAILVAPRQAAVAFLKGETKNAMPLRFVRIEPFVIPKKSLTGDSAERVDTRVLQIIFEMDRPGVPLYVGQQVDIYIEQKAAASASAETNGAVRVAEK